jgi:hypothetical protein
MKYRIYRHRWSKQIQPVGKKLFQEPVCVIEAPSADKALDLGVLVIPMYHEQYITAEPEEVYQKLLVSNERAVQQWIENRPADFVSLVTRWYNSVDSWIDDDPTIYPFPAESVLEVAWSSGLVLLTSWFEGVTLTTVQCEWVHPWQVREMVLKQFQRNQGGLQEFLLWLEKNLRLCPRSEPFASLAWYGQSCFTES